MVPRVITPALAGRHEIETTSGGYDPLPRLRRARTVRVGPESKGPEDLGPERPLRHVSGDRARPRVLGGRPKQMTNDQFQNPNGGPSLVRSLSLRYRWRYHVWSLVI